MNRTDRYEIIHFTAKEMMAAGYGGHCGGALKGAHYVIREIGKGLCSLDGGRTVFNLGGRLGKESMQRIIDKGGFVGEISYRQTL